jgi:hypothetical protein
VHQSFRVHPAQRVPSDGELPRVLIDDINKFDAAAITAKAKSMTI